MNPEDMSSLHDIYASLGDGQPKQASYMLQFVWRDLTYSFDIIGLYYSSSESLKTQVCSNLCVRGDEDFPAIWISNIGVGI